MAQEQLETRGYAHLIARPHPWRRQLCLRGRNITVGQLIASMRANELSPSEAAEQFDLPLTQIEEALAYYAANCALVDRELRQDRRRLEARGYPVEPPAVP
jgi:uncharacterized protein (DUF433 family)